MNTKTIGIESVLRDVGATEYDVQAGVPRTAKVSRWRLADGQPLAIQTNCLIPRIWMLTKYGRRLAELGRTEFYQANQGRHSNLEQIREFCGEPLVKVVLEKSVEDFRRVIADIGSRL